MKKLNGLQIYLIIVLASVHSLTIIGALTDSATLNLQGLVGITVFMILAIYLAKER